MQPIIRIRPAVGDDAALLYEISRRTFYDTFAVYNTPENMDLYLNHQLTATSMAAEVADPANLFLLAYIGDQPAGGTQRQENHMRLAPEGAAGAEPEGKPAIEIVRIPAEQ